VIKISERIKFKKNKYISFREVFSKNNEIDESIRITPKEGRKVTMN